MKILVKETNQYLYFSPGTKVNVQINNSIFEEPGSYTYPFEIDLDKNRKALNFPDKLSMAIIRKNIEAFFYIGNKQITANILVLSVANSKVSISLMFNDSFFNASIREKYLDEINFDDILLGYTEQDIIDFLNAGCYLNYPNREFAVYPFSGNGVNNCNRYIWGMNPVYIYSFENNTITVPFFYLNYILDNIFKNDIRLKLSHLKIDAELNTLTIMTLFTGFPNVANPAGVKINAVNYMPHIKIGDLLKGLTSTFNVRYYKSPFSNEVSIILFNKLFAQMYHADLTQFVEDSNDIDYSSIIEGLELSANFDANCDYYKSQLEDIGSANVIHGTFLNVVDFPAPDITNKNFIAYTYATTGRDKLYYKSDGVNWNFFSRDSQNVKIGENGENIGKVLPAVLNSNWQDETAPDNFIDYYGPTYNPPAWGSMEQSLMLCFYRGMFLKAPHPGLDGDYVPYGSGDRFKENGLENNVNYTLLTEGEKGLYKQFWEKYFEWKVKTIIVKKRLLLKADQAFNFDMSKKYRIDKIDYFIKNMQFSIRMEDDAITPITLTLFKA